jgi:hypothetical protein
MRVSGDLATITGVERHSDCEVIAQARLAVFVELGQSGAAGDCAPEMVQVYWAASTVRHTTVQPNSTCLGG